MTPERVFQKHPLIRKILERWCSTCNPKLTIVDLIANAYLVVQ